VPPSRCWHPGAGPASRRWAAGLQLGLGSAGQPCTKPPGQRSRGGIGWRSRRACLRSPTRASWGRLHTHTVAVSRASSPCRGPQAAPREPAPDHGVFWGLLAVLGGSGCQQPGSRRGQGSAQRVTSFPALRSRSRRLLSIGIFSSISRVI
jgi:hypothetical protein